MRFTVQRKNPATTMVLKLFARNSSESLVIKLLGNTHNSESLIDYAFLSCEMSDNTPRSLILTALAPHYIYIDTLVSTTENGSVGGQTHRIGRGRRHTPCHPSQADKCSAPSQTHSPPTSAGDSPCERPSSPSGRRDTRENKYRRLDWVGKS